MNRFNLSSVTLNEGLKTIGSDAFQDCSFTEIIIPNSIENLYSDAFFYCEQLANVYYNATLEQWCNINVHQVILGLRVSQADYNFYKKLVGAINSNIPVRKIQKDEIEDGFIHKC